MATLAAWRFDTPTGAEESVAALHAVACPSGVVLRDAATVSWELAWTKPRPRQVPWDCPEGNLGSAFWGLLFGMIFFVPLLGAATGAAGGALSGSLTDIGIGDSFINRVRDQITPGTSALFVLGSDADVEMLGTALTAQGATRRILTSLSTEQDAALRSVFAEEGMATP